MTLLLLAKPIKLKDNIKSIL